MAIHIRRREFIITLGSAAAAWPLAVRAQQPGERPRRIGVLTAGAAADGPDVEARIAAFLQVLQQLGWTDGRNVRIDYRLGLGAPDSIRKYAAELVALAPDVIVAGAGTPSALAAQQATATIPIVVPAMGDPVRDGLVASLPRPGGNVTGLTFLGPELVPKRLGLLKEVLPNVSHVGALWHPDAYGERTMRDMLEQARSAATALGLELALVEARSPDELERAVAAIAGARAQALFPFPSPMLFTERRRIVELAAMHRLPGMFNAHEFVELGGLISYGVSLTQLYRGSAAYVDKILKGAKPADLPVQQPTKFELVINLKTAKALGITIPPTLLARADEVIE